MPHSLVETSKCSRVTEQFHFSAVRGTDTNKGKVILDYEPDILYKQEGADPNDAPDAQEEEEGDNSDAQYEKMEFPHQRIL